MKGFFDCRNCFHWARIPSGFDERFHLVRCRKCGEIMNFNRSMDPIKDLAYSPTKEIKGLVIEQ